MAKISRKVSSQRYVIAGVITFLIFALGLLLGMVMDYERVQYMENQYVENDLDYRSLQLQFSFLDMVENDESCAAFEQAMESAVTELSDSLQEVERYEEYAKSQQDNFEIIKRRYTLDNIRYWIIVQEAQKRCTMNRLSILYFYSSSSCNECPDQGVILTYFKKRFGDHLLVFPIDVDLAESEPMIRVIRSRYNISYYPSLVINDKAYPGVVSKNDLAPLICAGLGRNVGDCS